MENLNQTITTEAEFEDFQNRQNALFSLGVDICFSLGLTDEFGLIIGKKLVDREGNIILR